MTANPNNQTERCELHDVPYCDICSGNMSRLVDEYKNHDAVMNGKEKTSLKVVEEIDPAPHLQAQEGQKPCIVKGCTRARESRKMCHKHYIQWTKGKLAGAPEFARTLSKVRLPCIVDDCHEPSKARGYCPKHYGNWYYQNKDKIIKEKAMEEQAECKAPDPDLSEVEDAIKNQWEYIESILSVFNIDPKDLKRAKHHYRIGFLDGVQHGAEAGE